MSSFQRLPKRFHPDFRIPGKKPVGAVEVDWSNPITRGMRLAVAPALEGNSNLVSRDLPLSSSGANWAQEQGGIRFESNGYFEYDKGGSDVSSTRTMLTIMSMSGSSESIGVASANSAATDEYAAVGGKVGQYFVYYFRDGNSNWITYGTPAEGQIYTLVGVSRGSVTHALWIDGSEVGVSSAYSPSIASDSFSVGQVLDLSPSSGVSTNYLSVVWDRGLSDSEIRSISKNPYQILKPANDNYGYYIPSGGGGPTPVTADLTAQWNLLQAVQSDANLQWSLLNAVQQSADLQWSILNSVQQDADLQWSIIQAVQQDADLQWNILAALSAVQSDLTAQWNILQGVFADSESRWSILNSVFSDSEARWSILSSVLSDADLRWNVLSALSSVSNDLELRWDMSGKVFSSLTAQWNIFNAVTSDADLRWSILNAISQDLSTRWDVVEAVQAGADLRWDIIAATDSTLTLRWNIASETQFPDLEGVITLESKTPVFTVSSLTPKITVH